VLQGNNQLPAMIGEVARSKALAFVLSKAKVVDTKGKDVDVSAFTASALGDGDDSSDANDLITAAPHGSASGGKDAHGRKPGNEHYGHDHK
jgi:trigger factor